MAKDQAKEAKKIAQAQQRWQAMMKKEAAKEAKRAKEVKKPNKLMIMINQFNERIQIIVDILVAPLHLIRKQMAASKRIREARRLAKMEKKRPILEEKARKRLAKKMAKEAMREEKRAALELKRKEKGNFFANLVKGFNKKVDGFFLALAQPGNAWKAHRKKVEQAKHDKKMAKLEKTATVRREKSQKKHARVLRRAAAKQVRKQKRRERRLRIKAKFSGFLRFWASIAIIRRIIYLIALGVYLYIKREPIINYVSEVLNYDLQSLVR